METPANTIESLFQKVETYGLTTYELSKLKLLETTTVIATALIPRLSVVLMISLFIFVVSIGIALFLGEMLGKSYYGFYIVAAVYLLTAIILHFFLRRWIKKPISDLIIKQALQ